MKNFVLIGAPQYIVPRHIKTIKKTKNELVAILFSYDIMDRYFPQTSYFTKFEKLNKFVNKWHKDGNKKSN